MGGEVAVGVEAPALPHETDALELKGRDALCLFGRHLTTHVHERAPAANTLGQRLTLARRAIS